MALYGAIPLIWAIHRLEGLWEGVAEFLGIRAQRLVKEFNCHDHNKETISNKLHLRTSDYRCMNISSSVRPDRREHRLGVGIPSPSC